MSRLDLDSLSPEERLLAEQVVLNLRALNDACDRAADGTVLNVCESLAMSQGRELIRRAIENTLLKQAQATEKKGLRPDAATASPPRLTAPRPTAAKSRGRF
jgi:hypothetical protein